MTDVPRAVPGFRDRDLWATSIAGVTWIAIAVLSVVGTVALLAVPYGFFDIPFYAVFAVVAGYFARGIFLRRRILVAIAASLTAITLASLWLAAGFVAGSLVALIPSASSLIAAWQIRQRDVEAARLTGDSGTVMSLRSIASRVVVELLSVALVFGGLWLISEGGPLAAAPQR